MFLSSLPISLNLKCVRSAPFRSFFPPDWCGHLFIQ
jgi:hypothetical protein